MCSYSAGCVEVELGKLGDITRRGIISDNGRHWFDPEFGLRLDLKTDNKKFREVSRNKNAKVGCVPSVVF